jgi:hypothetical protein
MASTLLQIVGIALTVGLILLILELVRRKRLQERYALVWLLCSVVLFVFAAWRGLLSTISFKLGIHYPPALLFAVAFGAELLLLLHFSLAVSSLTDQNKILAQRLGLLQHRVEEQERRLNELEGGTHEADAPRSRSRLSRTG